MTVINNSVEIRCSPEEAFDYLSDHRSELQWNLASSPSTSSPTDLSALGTKCHRRGVSQRREGPPIECDQ